MRGGTSGSLAEVQMCMYVCMIELLADVCVCMSQKSLERVCMFEARKRVCMFEALKRLCMYASNIHT